MESARTIIEQFNGVFAHSPGLRNECLSDISYRGLSLPEPSWKKFDNQSPFTTGGIFMFGELVDMNIDGDIVALTFIIEDSDSELSHDDSELRFVLSGPVHLLDIHEE